MFVDDTGGCCVAASSISSKSRVPLTWPWASVKRVSRDALNGQEEGFGEVWFVWYSPSYTLTLVLKQAESAQEKGRCERSTAPFFFLSSESVDRQAWDASSRGYVTEALCSR